VRVWVWVWVWGCDDLSAEELTVCTIGMANFDTRALEGVALPAELFQRGAGLRAREIEALVQQHVPLLAGKIVCIAERKITRAAPSDNSHFLL
jgi:hypothetical protein